MNSSFFYKFNVVYDVKVYENLDWLSSVSRVFWVTLDLAESGRRGYIFGIMKKNKLYFIDKFFE